MSHAMTFTIASPVVQPALQPQTQQATTAPSSTSFLSTHSPSSRTFISPNLSQSQDIHTADMAASTESSDSRQPPTQKILLKDIAVLWTGENDEIQTSSSIFIDNGIIQWIGKNEHMPVSLQSAEHVVMNMSNRIVIPGLINTHHHMYQSLTKCIARDSQLFEWLQTLYQIWRHLTPTMIYNSAKFSMAELLLSGCTTTSDMLYLYPNGITLDDTIRAACELGMRFMPCRGAVSVGESKGGLPPDSLVEKEDEILSDMERLIEKYHDNRDGAMVRIVLAPCSPFSVSQDLMINAARLARKYEKVMLHTHYAENQSDMDYMNNSVQRSLTKFLDDCEWNKDDCWFAHCVKLDQDKDDDALQYFADNGLSVAHCPVSNCRLASGIAPIRKMLDRGIAVGLGVDGSASNDSGNILAEARMAMMLARVREERADAMSALDVLKMATSGGAKIMGRNDIGILKAGMCADIVGWRIDEPAFAGTFHSKMAMLSALIMGNAGDLKADFVMVNGNMAVWDGKLTGEESMSDITREHNASALKLAGAATKAEIEERN